jgi:hypothetical protein
MVGIAAASRQYTASIKARAGGESKQKRKGHLALHSAAADSARSDAVGGEAENT